MMAYLKILIGIIIIGIIFPLLLFLLYLRPVKFISNTNPSDFNLEYEDVSFKTKDGLILRGWFIPSNFSNSTIIIGHGFPFDKGNILPATKFLNKHYNLFYYDFRYFGESEGKITTIAHKEKDDMLKAIEYLKKRKDVDKIGIMGFSLSAANALLVSAGSDPNSKEIKAIISDSSYSDIYEILKRVYWFLPSITKYPFMWMTSFYTKIFLNINLSELSPINKIESVQTPIFFIHGEKDSQISAKQSKALHEKSPNSELWIVKGADHGMSFSMNKKEYEKRTLNFFDKYLLKKMV